MAQEAKKTAKKPAKKQEVAATTEPTLTLTMLRPAKGSTKTKLRVGRGRASGAGKTSNRGHNGEGQRSGRSRKVGFEGGQMPGYRQMPKIRGFHLVDPKNWLEINIGDLDNYLTADDTELTYELLAQRGFMKKTHDGVRLLGNGELSRKLTVHAHHVTAGARAKIEAAGGSIQLLTSAAAS